MSTGACQRKAIWLLSAIWAARWLSSSAAFFAKRLDGKLPGPVGVAFCGDGTTSTGAFHEAANMANVERLPLVLVVTNNQFAYSTPNIRGIRRSLPDGQGPRLRIHRA